MPRCIWCGREFYGNEGWCSQRCQMEQYAHEHPPATPSPSFPPTPVVPNPEPVRTCAYCGKPVGTGGRVAPDGSSVCGLKCYKAYLTEAEKNRAASAAEAAEGWVDWLVRLAEAPLLAFDKAALRASGGYRLSLVVPDVSLPFGDFREFNGLGMPARLSATDRWGNALPASVCRFAEWLDRLGVPFARVQVAEKGSGWFAKDTVRPGGIDWCLAGTANAGGKTFRLFRLQLQFKVGAIVGRERDDAETGALLGWFERYKADLPAAWAMSEFARASNDGWVDEDEVSWDLIRREFAARTGKELPGTGWKLPTPSEFAKSAAPKRMAGPAFAAAERPPEPPAAPPVESGGLWARPGLSSEIAFKGCSWASKGGWATIEAEAAAVENRSPWDTGSLKFVFWLCRGPAGENGLDGAVQMGEAWASKPPLGRGAKLAGVSVSMRRTGNPPTGDYRAVLTVNERNADGRNYIVGWCNFPKPVRWTHR